MLPINQQQQQPPPPPATTRKSVTGFVTKLVGDGATYGFINDEIFFQQTSVVGPGPAAVNDRVFAECEYSAHLPIKWNATSVKIISKAAGQQQQSQPSAILESDPRRQSRQSSFNQPPPSQPQQQQQQPPQQQQAPPPMPLQTAPFNQSPNASVAITYQQHRQQRQMHRQTLDPTNQQLDAGINSDLHQDQHQQPRLLDQANNPGEPFYGIANNPPPPFVAQQQTGEMEPFHQDTPMGPPKLAYTSQLGSAFVQNPMMANSFIPQHPPPPPNMLQQPPPPVPQQQLHHHQQQQHQQQQQQNNQQQQSQNHHNKGARFNNQQDKNDRQNLRRNQRTDGRNDQNRRSVDRDRDQQSHNNNRSRQADSRERSANRSNIKRDDGPSRPSPPARSTTSVSSDRANRTRRHYETKNIPKSRLLIDLNGWNMRHRCSSSIHVPSDLKSVIVNQHFRLDIKNTPKPVEFKIEQVEQPKPAINEENPQQDTNTTSETTGTKAETVTDDSEVSQDKTEVDAESVSSSSNIKPKKDDTHTPPSSKSDIRLNHKYGVKVILISIPELETIYKKIFGENLDSFSSDSKSHQKLDEAISLLCNKGANGGFSLIGGKFDPVLDGFVEGETNEFERHGRQPDLIATCKRVVMDQANLDLGSCRSWTHVSTLMYNNKSDYFSQKASIEYSYIYMPQIWTISAEKFDKNIIEKESVEVKENTSDIVPDATEEPEEATKMETSESEITTGEPATDGPVVAQPTQLTLENLSELKVIDLKAELDRRDIKYKPNAKKAELLALLQGLLAPSGDQQPAPVADGDQTDETTGETGEENKPAKEEKSEQPQLEEGEVADSPGDDEATVDQTIETEGGPAEVQSAKRKESEVEASDQESNKKIRTDEEKKVEKKVELIREPFVVKPKEGQQQLSLVSLYDAAQVGRYDQFELSVASGLLREALIQHLSEYIFTALIEDRQKQTTTSVGDTLSGNSSQDTNSDSNNNTNKSVKGANQQTVSTASPSTDKANLKELPVDRYVNLAFTYFDSSHTGQIQVDDLSKLFNNTGLTISKRALMSLVGDGDKYNYRNLPDLCPMLASYIYKFPEQFNRLPGSSPASASGPTTGGKMVQFQGVSYDVEKLIQQVRDAETLRISLVDRFNYAILNHDKQTEEIHVLEVSQKSLSRAIKAQNDEICELKRERDSIKKKLDNLRRSIKAPINSLSDLLKEDK